MPCNRRTPLGATNFTLLLVLATARPTPDILRLGCGVCVGAKNRGFSHHRRLTAENEKLRLVLCCKFCITIAKIKKGRVNLIFSGVLVISGQLRWFSFIITQGKKRFFAVKLTRLSNMEVGHFSGKCENLFLARNHGGCCWQSYCGGFGRGCGGFFAYDCKKNDTPHCINCAFF